MSVINVCKGKEHLSSVMKSMRQIKKCHLIVFMWCACNEGLFTLDDPQCSVDGMVRVHIASHNFGSSADVVLSLTTNGSENGLAY